MAIESVTNEEVIITGFGTLESMTLHPLSPKYRSINIIVALAIGSIIASIIFLVAIQPFVTMPQNYLEYYYIPISIVAFLTLWSVTYHFFADPKKKYALRQFDVHYQSGLLFFKTVSQPIMRIQHIEIERGPIERSAGLATLQVFSAGGASHTFEIPGLPHDTAIELRQFILNHKDVSQDG